MPADKKFLARPKGIGAERTGSCGWPEPITVSLVANNGCLCGSKERHLCLPCAFICLGKGVIVDVPHGTDRETVIGAPVPIMSTYCRISTMFSSGFLRSFPSTCEWATPKRRSTRFRRTSEKNSPSCCLIDGSRNILSIAAKTANASLIRLTSDAGSGVLHDVGTSRPELSYRSLTALS